MQTQFHPLTVTKRSELTSDSFCLTLAVPPALRETFSFEPGQYLTIRSPAIATDQTILRRSYSICSSQAEFLHKGEISIGIKRVEGGQFSEPAYELLKRGVQLEAMAPAGRFTIDASLKDAHHVAFAAGSGITPILAMMHAVLTGSNTSRFTLIYGNRSSANMMFLETLEGLKNQFLSRLRLIHVLSQQPQEIALFNGRIDHEKVTQLTQHLLPTDTIDVAWLCGPDSMIDQVQQALIEAGVDPQAIRSERFGQPNKAAQPKLVTQTDTQHAAQLTVVADGKSKLMTFHFAGDSLLDTALHAGMDLPYACKNGVCCTCRAKVISGEVKMDKNYTLEAWEVKQGFVLTCQCLPLTDQVTVSFDER